MVSITKTTVTLDHNELVEAIFNFIAEHKSSASVGKIDKDFMKDHLMIDFNVDSRYTVMVKINQQKLTTSHI